MIIRETPAEARVLVAACLATQLGSFGSWHTVAYDEFYLVTEGSIYAGLAEEKVKIAPDTLILVHNGESRGFWNVSNQNPKLWTLLFTPGAQPYEGLPALRETDPRKRIWKLTPDQVLTFKSLFVKIAAERSSKRTANAIAETAWLRLLMVMLQRWTEARPKEVAAQSAGSDLLNLWQKINDSIWQPASTRTQLYADMPNYDSLRHRFRKTFGSSPQKLLMSMRMDQAKSLLLESSNTIKEIALRLGYARQHEFARAFHKYVGCSPTKWRQDPFFPVR